MRRLQCTVLGIGMLLGSAATALAETKTMATAGTTGPKAINNDVPRPIVTDRRGAGSDPPEDAWDGSYAELLAADALATCWMTHREKPWKELVNQDPIIQRLHTKIVGATCNAHEWCSDENQTDPVAIDLCRWQDGRADPKCNVDAYTSEPRALDRAQERAANATEAYRLPEVPVVGTSNARVRDVARTVLQQAEVSLCMAELLHEKLDSVQVAFASGDDLAAVQERIRERALTATYNYSIAAKAFATILPPPVVEHERYYHALLTRWGQSNSTKPAVWRQIGQDFGEAIRLLAEATHAVAELTLRQPSAQRTFGIPDPYGYLGTGGLVGPRNDLLVVLYGCAGDYCPSRRAGTVDTSAPEVGVLLGLARAADALEIPIAAGRIERMKAATGLMMKVENHLRTTEAARGGPAEPAVDETTRSQDYLLWKRHRIGLGHAQALVDALISELFGPAVSSVLSRSDWPLDSNATKVVNPFSVDPGGPLGPGEQLGLHLFGQHSFSGTITTGRRDRVEGTVHIDPQFHVGRLSATDIQSMRPHGMPLTGMLHPGGSAELQLPKLGWTWGPTGKPTVGSVSALAFARQSILDLGMLPTNQPVHSMFKAASPTLELIEMEIGSRQAILTPYLTSGEPDAEGCESSCYREKLDEHNGETRYGLTIITRPSDPMTSFWFGPGIAHAATAVLAPSFRSIWGRGGAEISSQSYQTMAVRNLPLGYQARSAKIAITENHSDPHGVTILLRSDESATAASAYEHVYTGHRTGFPDRAGAVIAFGGQLATVVERAFAFDNDNWSRPTYDAFGLPHDWAPGPDATVAGDPGATIQQHYLARASSAAAEATSAINDAIMAVEHESSDQEALRAADARANGMHVAELMALLGPGSGGRDFDSVRWIACSSRNVKVLLPECPRYHVDPAGSTEAEADRSDNPGEFSTQEDYEACNLAREQIASLVGTRTAKTEPMNQWMAVPEPVASELESSLPQFAAYTGGTLQGLFTDNWGAWRSRERAMRTALASYSAATVQVRAAEKEDESAQADFALAKVDALAAYELLEEKKASLRAQKTQFDNLSSDYVFQMKELQRAHQEKCSTEAFNMAFNAGRSWSNNEIPVRPPRVVFDPALDTSRNPVFLKHGEGGSQSFSAGPYYAAAEECRQASAQDNRDNPNSRWNVISKQQVAISRVAQELESGLAKLNLADSPQRKAIAERLEAAMVRRELARERRRQAEFQRAAQYATSLSEVQSAQTQLLRSLAAVDQACGQVDVAQARQAVEARQVEYDVRNRFGLRRRFRSYDLWRARALSESARRLSVAARRAIESRFVVDLSDLRGLEPFVGAPAQWADDIYASDLKPPSVLGLTTNARNGSGIYRSALTDYVENLRLFLDGYSVQRPTATVRSDAEVVQLPGPSPQRSGSTKGVEYWYIDPAAGGWSFYCENSGRWIPHPDASLVPVNPPRWRLSTACNGEAPVRARLGFWLDPWARLERGISALPYRQRYNVRLGRVAVNIVGAGVRDCSKTADQSVCYAEPFLRYDLAHIGPAWVTDFQQMWHAPNLPIGMIEGGKALATEDWLDPVSNGFNRDFVANVARQEFDERPVGGQYELTMDLTGDTRVERIERIQLLVETRYWVRSEAPNVDDSEPDGIDGTGGSGGARDGGGQQGDAAGADGGVADGAGGPNSEAGVGGDDCGKADGSGGAGGASTDGGSDRAGEAGGAGTGGGDDAGGSNSACAASYDASRWTSYHPNSVTESATVVSRDGHNWECATVDCRNCATYASCSPARSGCPWGVVWTDRGACR